MPLAFIAAGLAAAFISNIIIEHLPRKNPLTINLGYLFGGSRKRMAAIYLISVTLWLTPVLILRDSSILGIIISGLFGSLLLIIACIDLRHMIIPDSLIIALCLLLIPALAAEPPMWFDRMLGGVTGGGILLLFAFLSEKIFKKEGIGGGDIKLLASCGLILGYRLVLPALFLGSVAALPFLIFLRFSGQKIGKQTVFPFAPPLCAGILICYYFGYDLISWYLNIAS